MRGTQSVQWSSSPKLGDEELDELDELLEELDEVLFEEDCELPFSLLFLLHAVISSVAEMKDNKIIKNFFIITLLPFLFIKIL